MFQKSNLTFFGLQLSFNNSETKHCNITLDNQTFNAFETAIEEKIFWLHIDELKTTGEPLALTINNKSKIKNQPSYCSSPGKVTIDYMHIVPYVPP